MIADATEDGLASNCEWLNGALAEAIEEHGDPELQQVHIYEGSEHVITDDLDHPVQGDLRAWYEAAAGQE